MNRDHGQSQGLLATLGCAVFLLGCAGEEITEGPDLDSVLAIYQNPTGSLPEEELEALIEQALAADAMVRAIGGLDIVVQSLKPVADSISQAGGSETTKKLKLRFLLSGMGAVEQVCPGLSASPTVDPENGAVNYQVSLRDNFILKTIWGTFEQCQLHSDGQGGTLDATWALSLGTNKLISQFEFEAILVQIQGTLALPESQISIDRDFVVQRDKTIEVRIAVSDGDVVCSSDRGMDRISIRTNSGAFCCVVSDQECYALEGNTCESQDAGGKRISW